MKSLKKKRRIQILVAAAVALVLAVGLIGYGFRDGINLYRSPSQMAENPPEAGEVFRLGGLVEDGSLVRGASETVTFRVTDGGATVPVRFTGVLPDLFSEGQGMIGTGRMEGETFVASEILAKHDENYMPREVMDSLKEQGVYQEPNS
ncbi:MULTISPECIES: cytochrome c maturation protein CcmE [Paracoccus]|jgi:cytochrome c-type biogenesis protein CcmE|uniref:Cytochrome c-type biogenesis protein CcmE n=1 Tax=Paracoccus denitrificans (strain Pd 1222) TaxID=318586 RepID=CCME_PARDP|nr:MULTISPECIES: cytochrome c maturation protein CcmE [Paracoccus]A1B946.1 RecName: Full=Cytochrome c-type biogenesis protein CcmE; AltName: Full=Cytochrome c maturation protein E; AltName: Full=Heme chaperone CcmE [Paracoccus denitrificans PD1222]ABL72040.1 CcmE/CycJ protein [Paracoccus denitrificans PD1222]MBB4626053.1 cytochrome c-type biogenesis protein CcmE [Paracoccus denitrificans]MCU7426787.1 cytochrome c maturation protein CcmE [Paracoccus denitrificans]MDK8871990.1 cytochrome c matur